MAGKGEWERLWLVNKLLSVWKATVHMLGEVSVKAWNCVLGWGTYTWSGPCAPVPLWKGQNSGTWCIHRLGWLRDARAGGGSCWDDLIWGRCWGASMHRVSLHLSGLTSSSWGVQVYGVSHHAKSRAQHFGVCALPCTVLGSEDFSEQPHEEHLAGVVSWICCSPAVLASADCFAAEYAAVGKSKGKFLFKAIWKNC